MSEPIHARFPQTVEAGDLARAFSGTYEVSGGLPETVSLDIDGGTARGDLFAAEDHGATVDLTLSVGCFTDADGDEHDFDKRTFTVAPDSILEVHDS